MRTKTRRGFGGVSRLAVLTAGLLTLSLWVTPDAAFADSRDRDRRPRGLRTQGWSRGPVWQKESRRFRKNRRISPAPSPRFRQRQHRSFRVPRRLGDRRGHEFRRFLRGSFYYAPHRHRHFVYGFPVYNRFGVTYRPHVYCHGDHFGEGFIGFSGPRFGFQIAF